MVLIFSVFLLFSVLIVNGQIQFVGKCNNVTTQSMFNFTKYLGEWYEIEKFPTIFQKEAACITVNYNRLKNSTVEVENYMSLVGRNITLHGTIEEINSTAQDGKLNLNFPAVRLFNTEYWVLGTDYINYAVVWSCKQEINTNQQFAWILSRSPKESEAQRNEVYKIIQNNKLDISRFMKVNQTHCMHKHHKKSSASFISVNLSLICALMFIKTLF